MELQTITRIGLPIAMLAFIVVTLVIPARRLRRQTGHLPLVFHRKADPYQPLMMLAFGVFFPGVAIWSVLYAVLGPAKLGVWDLPDWTLLCGWVLLLAGTALVFLAQSHMGQSLRIGIDDRETELVTRGVFNYVRNPIFLGVLLALAGVVLFSLQSLAVALWFVVALFIGIQTRLEERHLIRVHGLEYARYASRVGRFIPLIGKLKVQGATASAESS